MLKSSRECNLLINKLIKFDYERDSLSVRKDLSGQLSGSLLSLYSFSKPWKISFTDDILVALKALLPAKAKPFSKSPLSAFISAMIISAKFVMATRTLTPMTPWVFSQLKDSRFLMLSFILFKHFVNLIHYTGLHLKNR